MIFILYLLLIFFHFRRGSLSSTNLRFLEGAALALLIPSSKRLFITLLITGLVISSYVIECFHIAVLVRILPEPRLRIFMLRK